MYDKHIVGRIKLFKSTFALSSSYIPARLQKSQVGISPLSVHLCNGIYDTATLKSFVKPE